MASKTKKAVIPAETPKLIAKRPILFDGRQFNTGDQLPCYDARMVEAWLKYQSAEWVGKAEKPDEKPEKAEKPAEGKKEETKPEEPEADSEEGEKAEA